MPSKKSAAVLPDSTKTRTRKRRAASRFRSKFTFHLDADSLFKYCDARGLDILQSLRLKVTPPKEFNDPFEFMPKVEFRISPAAIRKGMVSDKLLRDVWRQFCPEMEFETFRSLYVAKFEEEGDSHVEDVLQQLQVAAAEARDDILDFMSSRFALACYSESADNFLMWSHYTSGHQGVVVAFNVKDEFFTKTGNLMPIAYRSERVSASYDRRGLDFDEPEIGLVRTKNLDWSYEKEWRQMFPLQKCNRLHVEPGRVCYFQSLPPTAISAVILGVRCHPETEAAIRELVRRRDLRHVRVRRAVLHENAYRLKIV